MRWRREKVCVTWLCIKGDCLAKASVALAEGRSEAL